MRVCSLPLLAKIKIRIRKYMIPEVRSMQNLFNRPHKTLKAADVHRTVEGGNYRWSTEPSADENLQPMEYLRQVYIMGWSCKRRRQENLR
jgi:hypothetical protein